MKPPPSIDATFAHEVLEGLRSSPRTLPCKYFYDERGSDLFDRICELPEYYPTRTELEIMQSRAQHIAAALGPECTIVEFGSGTGLKTRLLLELLENPIAYAPVEICAEVLDASTAALRDRFPELQVVPSHADYTRTVSLDLPAGGRRVVFFPGSTIGNFTPAQARAFLGRIVRLVGSRGGLLIGVDLKKDPAVLHAAYNDAEGVTARFNLNLLHRINRELEADVDVDAFRHYAFYNPSEGRVEMHLVCLRGHTATIAGEAVEFRGGEAIHTESSYKYSLTEFAELAGGAGLELRQAWLDDDQLFSVQYYEAL